MLEPISPSSFYVRITKLSAIKELESMLAELLVSLPAQLADFSPKAGSVVAACYTVSDEWHRAKIRKVLAGKRGFEVVYVDRGNSEALPPDRL
ncbi:hypothetical protein FBU59_006588, partial [Linderina macrospora]